MNASYQQLLLLSTLIHCVLYLAMLAIVIIGWRRHRHVGYLILIVWVLVALGAVAGRSLWMRYVQTFASKLFGNGFDASMVMIVLNVLSGIATSLLLCIGLAALVFVPPRPR